MVGTHVWCVLADAGVRRELGGVLERVGLENPELIGAREVVADLEGYEKVRIIVEAESRGRARREGARSGLEERIRGALVPLVGEISLGELVQLTRVLFVDVCMERADGSVSEAARLLSVSRQSVYAHLRGARGAVRRKRSFADPSTGGRGR